MNSFLKRLSNELLRQQENSLTRCLKASQPCRVDLSSNDYLCLRKHPDVLAEAEKAQAEFGVGSGASPLISGFLSCHEKLLNLLKDWKSKPGGVLFNSGFMANQAVLKYLPGPKDLVLADKLSHHSIIQAMLSGKAKFKRYPHLDIDYLDELLLKNKKNYETIFVVTESIFSMDGDYPDLKRIAKLKEKDRFVWILDEAHAVGCFGPSGGGLAEAEGVLNAVDVFIGTLGKALGSMGGYVLTADRKVADYLINFAGELIYSTFMPPSQAGAAISAIDKVQKMSEKREHPCELGANLRYKLRTAGWETNSFDSQIVPVIIGDNAKTLEIKNRLQNAGIRVGAVRPPTVPPKTARLRISLHKKVTLEQLDELIKILNSC